MLSIPFDGTIGALSSSGLRWAGGFFSGRRSTPEGAAWGSGGSAPSGHVGTCAPGDAVSVEVVAVGSDDEGVVVSPVVQATATIPAIANTAMARATREGRARIASCYRSQPSPP